MLVGGWAVQAGAASTARDFSPGPFLQAPAMPVSFYRDAELIRTTRPLPSTLVNLAKTTTSTSTKSTSTTTTTTLSAQRVGGDTSPLGPASITELSRALRGDPDLIYEFVRNNIEYAPVWGLQKGSEGTLLDNQGTSFDQAMLMVDLLRAGGVTAGYVLGYINLTPQQVHDWWGLDASNLCAVYRYLGMTQRPVVRINGAAPQATCPGGALTSLTVGHVWVSAVIGGTTYHFDPSFKPHAVNPGIDLATASGFDVNSYLSAARAGATISTDFVQNINRAALRNNLTSYASTLATHLRNNYPAASLDDVLGGMTVVPSTGIVRQTALSYRATDLSQGDYTALDDSLVIALRIQYAGLDALFRSNDIYGKRLTITYNASNQPVLTLDGTVIQTSASAVTPGTVGDVTFTVVHQAYTSLLSNQQFTQKLKAGNGATYLVANGWGPVGRGLIERHRARLDDLRASGASDTSEAVLGSSLALVAAQWLTQYSQVFHATAQMADAILINQHQVGIAGYTTAPYVDLPGNSAGIVSRTGNAAAESAAGIMLAGHLSILESTTVEQVTGVSAVSTTKLLDIANSNGLKIYSATQANYGSVVQPALQGCGDNLLNFNDAVLNGARLVLPASCLLQENNWTGVGYFNLKLTSGNASYGAVISGGYSGGFPTLDLPAFNFNLNTDFSQELISPTYNFQFSGLSFGDPIDMVKGHYLYSHDDITTGLGGFPYSLGFQRLYSSGLRTQNGPLGKGWAHNLNGSVWVASDGLQGMGEDSALDAVASLVSMKVVYELMKQDTAYPLDKLVIATLGERWFGDQLTNNVVVVRQGLNGEVFVKLPDGSYNPPPGNSSRLILNGNGTYSYETVNRLRMDFNAAGKVVLVTHPSGVQVAYTYNGNDLAQVKNSLGRVLTFTTTSGRITAVSDGTRSVGYAYDANSNLSTFTDATSKSTTYQYDQPGRMQKFFYPSFPSTAVVTNTYDTLGRIQTQSDANSKLYTYYFAGSRSEEVAPGGISRKTYLDAFGNVIKAISPVNSNNVTVNEYDGQGRLARTVMPEGNSVEFVYDDATCASADKRCTHNPKTVRYVPKPGSGLTPFTRSFTYESAFNQVQTATDPAGQVTSYTYTGQGQPLTVTQPADDAGVQPQTTYGYTAYSASGFPAFYLPTSETVKTSASNAVTKATAYNAANSFVPQSVTEDAGSGKLNLVTAFTYDAAGNLLTLDGPRTDVVDGVANTYDAERRVTVTKPLNPTDALKQETRTTYDADGRATIVAAKLGSQWMVSCNTYTATGKLLKSWGPRLMSSPTTCPTAAAPVTVTDYAYDDLDRLMRVTENLLATQGGNRVRETVYNADSTVQIMKRAVGTALAQSYATYTYTANGQVATSKDAKNNVTTQEYDGFDRLVKRRYPSPSVAGTSSTTDYEQYTYDNNGNMLTYRKRSGATITNDYDNLNRLTDRVYPAPNAADSVKYGYDLRGLRTLAKFSDNSHSVVYDWDNAGRMVSTVSGGKMLSYQYDAAGNRTRITWPEVTPFYVSLSYDAQNRPTQIKENGSTNLATYLYDDLSRRAKVTLGNGNTTEYTFSPQSTLLTLKHLIGATTQDVTYTYTRDQRQALTGISWTNNIYQWTGYANGSKAYTSNGLNQYTSVAGVTPTYDSNGNLTSDGTWTYAYDLENRLRSGTTTGDALTASYDAEGRLRQTTLGGVTTGLFYDGVDLVAEYDGSGNVLRRYVHGPGVDEPLVWYEGSGTTTKNWLFADHQGSIIATSNAAGSATGTYNYGPYGEPNIATGVRFRYTGQQKIGNLYYYKARFYSPALGRFLQTDPIGSKDDLNLYAYVGADPLNNTDPTGLLSLANHEKVTFEALTALGLPSDLAMQYAKGVAGVDELPGSQLPENSAWHHMSIPGQSVADASVAYQNYVNFQISTGTDEGFMRAAHATQDSFPLGHRNFQSWDGFGALIFHPIDAIVHFIGDFFPSDEVMSNAISQTQQVYINWEIDRAFKSDIPTISPSSDLNFNFDFGGSSGLQNGFK